MRHTANFIERASLKRPAAFMLCCLLSLIACSMAQAQSGRRVSKRGSTTTPTAPSTETKETPKTATTAKPDKPQLSFYVCTSDRDVFMDIPRYLSESIRNIFVQRINQVSNIDVITGPDTQRGDAIKRAKSGESAYVVWLKLDVDSFDAQRTSSIGGIDPSKIIIRYTVFAPVTGKVKLDGRVYQRQYRMGRGGVGLPSPRRTNPGYTDYLLKEAARDAADHVLATFQYQPPRDPGLTSKER